MGNYTTEQQYFLALCTVLPFGEEVQGTGAGAGGVRLFAECSLFQRAAVSRVAALDLFPLSHIRRAEIQA